MNGRTAEQILQRRRVQNREAQRRFRARRSAQRTNPPPPVRGHAPSAYSQWRASSTMTEDSAPLPMMTFAGAAHMTELTHDGGWESVPADVMLTEKTSLFGYDAANGSTAAAEYHAARSLFTASDPGVARSVFHHVATSPKTNFIYDTSSSASHLTPRKDPPCTADRDRPPNARLSIQSAPGRYQPEDVYLPGLEQTTTPSIRLSNDKWESPLHLAAKKGSDRIIGLLLSHNSDCNERDSDGLTPLMHAVISGHIEATRLLLKHGAHVGQCAWDDGEWPRLSAIHWAVLKRREAILRILLEHCRGDDVINNYNDVSRAPLHLAIDIGFEAGVSILLEYGANPLQRTRRLT